jgi:hypothetical protein
MKNFLDKWALKRAEKIKQKEALEQKEREEQSRKYSDHKAKIENEIRKNIHALMEEYEKGEEHIKVGDRAILNYFSIKYPGRNSWDGGVGSLLNNIPAEERIAPVVVKITKMYVDSSFSNELIDRFFDNFSLDWLYYTYKVEDAWQCYLNWRKHALKKNGEDIESLSKVIGLYKTAHFEYEGSFKPKWGLNINSFHREGTPEFEKTFELWSREIEINRKKQELNLELQKLEAEMKQIDEEYRGIKVN